jgi:hypothetical protein
VTKPIAIRDDLILYGEPTIIIYIALYVTQPPAASGINTDPAIVFHGSFGRSDV